MIQHRPETAEEAFWVEILVGLRAFARAAKSLPPDHPLRGPALSSLGIVAKAIRMYRLGSPPPGHA